MSVIDMLIHGFIGSIFGAVGTYALMNLTNQLEYIPFIGFGVVAFWTILVVWIKIENISVG